MSKSNLRIENPCHLKWQDLTPLENSKDRHCHECAMNIIDFTKMTNKEIIAYLAERKGTKVCCAMRPNQEKPRLKTINRITNGWRDSVNKNIKNNHFKAFLLFSIGLLMLTTGCEKREIVIGLIEEPEESELLIKTTTKTNDSIATKTFNDKAELQ